MVWLGTTRMARYLAMVWLAILVQHNACSDESGVQSLSDDSLGDLDSSPGQAPAPAPGQAPAPAPGKAPGQAPAPAPGKGPGNSPENKQAGTRLTVSGGEGLCVGSSAGMADGAPISIEMCDSDASENWVFRKEVEADHRTLGLIACLSQEGLIQSVSQPELCIALEKDEDFGAGVQALIMSCRARPGAIWNIDSNGVHLRREPSLVLSSIEATAAVGQPLQLVNGASATHTLSTALHVHKGSTLQARYAPTKDGTIGSNFGGCDAEGCPCKGKLCYVPEDEALHWCDQVDKCEVISTNPSFTPTGTWSARMQLTDTAPLGGTISLAAAGDAAFCFGVRGSLAPSSEVQLQACAADEPKQMWLQTNGQIVSGADSSLCLSTAAGLKPSGQKLMVAACASLADENIQVDAAGQIKLPTAGLCATVAEGVAADGSDLLMIPCGPIGERSQQWSLAAEASKEQEAAEEADVGKLVDAAASGEVKEAKAKKQEKSLEAKELEDRKVELENNSAEAAEQTESKLKAMQVTDQRSSDQEKSAKDTIKARALRDKKLLVSHTATVSHLRAEVSQMWDTHADAEAKMRLTEKDALELRTKLDSATMQSKSLERSKLAALKEQSSTVEAATKAADEMNRLETSVNALTQQKTATLKRLRKEGEDASRRAAAAKDSSIQHRTAALEHSKEFGPKLVIAKGAAARAQVLLSRAEADSRNGADAAAAAADGARERLVQVKGDMAQLLADAKDQEQIMSTNQIPTMAEASKQHLKQLQLATDNAQRDYQDAANAAALAKQAVEHTKRMASKRRMELVSQTKATAASAVSAKLLVGSNKRKMKTAEDAVQALTYKEQDTEAATSIQGRADKAERYKAKAVALGIKLESVKNMRNKLATKKQTVQRSAMKLVAGEKFASGLVVEAEEAYHLQSSVARAAEQAKANAREQASQAQLNLKQLSTAMNSAMDAETLDMNEAETALLSTKHRARRALRRKQEFLSGQAARYDEQLSAATKRLSSLTAQVAVAESLLSHMKVSFRHSQQKGAKQVKAEAAKKAQAISAAQKSAAKESVWLNDDYSQKEQMAADNRKATVDAAGRTFSEASQLGHSRAAAFNKAKLDASDKLDGVQRQVDSMVSKAKAAKASTKARADKAAGDLLNQAEEASRSERDVERSMPSEDQMPVSVGPSCGCGGELGEGQSDDQSEGCPCAKKKDVSSEPDPVPAGRGAAYEAAADALARQEALAQSVEDTVALGNRQVQEANEQVEATEEQAAQILRTSKQDSNHDVNKAEVANDEAVKAIDKANSFLSMTKLAAKTKYSALMEPATKKLKTAIEALKHTLKDTISRANAEYAAAQSKQAIAVRFDSEKLAAESSQLDGLKATLHASQQARTTLEAKIQHLRHQNQIELQQAETEYRRAMAAAEQLQDNSKASTSVNVDIQKKKTREASAQQEGERDVSAKASEEEATARVMVRIAKNTASSAKLADSKAEDVRVAADHQVQQIDSELQVADQQVRLIGEAFASAQLKAGGGAASSGVAAAHALGGLEALKAKMVRDSSYLKGRQQALLKASTRAADLQHKSSQLSAKLEHMDAGYADGKQLAADDALELAESREQRLKTLADVAVQKLADAHGAADKQAGRLQKALKQLQATVVQKAALRTSRVQAATESVAYHEKTASELAAKEDTGSIKLLNAQKAAQAAVEAYSTLESSDDSFKKENVDLLRSDEEQGVMATNARDQIAMSLSKYDEQSKRALGSLRLQLDSVRSKSELAKNSAGAAAKDAKRLVSKHKAAATAEQGLRSKYEMLDKKLQQEIAKCNTMMRACRTKSRLLSLSERGLEALETQQTWTELRASKAAAHKSRKQANQDANDASDALLLAQRAAVDQRQRAIDLKKSMHATAESETNAMESATRATVAQFQESTTQAVSEANIDTARANGAEQSSLKQAANSRARANIQTTAADEKVNIAQARADKQEYKASSLKARAASIELQASRLTKQASDAREAMAIAETAREAAEIGHSEMRKEAVDVSTSWAEQLQTAKLSKANATGTLSILKAELEAQQYERDRVQASVDKIQDKQQTIEQEATEEAAAAEEAIRAAKTHESEKRGELSIRKKLAKQKSEDQLAEEQRNLAHQLTMEKMVLKTQNHIAINQVRTRGVMVRRDAAVRVLRHKGLQIATEAKHGLLNKQAEMYESIAKDAQGAKASFVAQMEENAKKHKAQMAASVDSTTTYTSLASVEDDGWTVSFALVLPPNLRGSKNTQSKTSCGLTGNFYAYTNQAGVGQMHKVLAGSRTAVLTFGNCWNAGTVRAYKNDVVIASAEPGEPQAVVEFKYKDGDELSIKDEGANSVVLLTSLTLKAEVHF